MLPLIITNALSSLRRITNALSSGGDGVTNALGSGENHKYHKQETARITNTQGSEEVESQITKRSFAADGHNHKSQRLMHHASLA